MNILKMFPTKLKIVHVGNPILRQISTPFSKEEISSPTLKSLIKDMFLIMKEDDGIGLAAPQINMSKQLVVIDVENSPTVKGLKLTMFNPELTLIGNENFEMLESCLSVPGIFGRVSRNSKVQVRYLDENGSKKKIRTSGLLAAVMQHEIDHLNGKIFLNRMTSSQLETSLAFNNQVEYILRSQDESLSGSWEYID